MTSDDLKNKKNRDENEEIDEMVDAQDAPHVINNELEEMKVKYLRALADYQNLEKRAAQARKEAFDLGSLVVVENFLPFLDNLEKAEVFIKDPGLKMIKDQLLQTLKQIGLKKIELLGTKYDPHKAEVIEVVDGKEDDEVVEEVESGFMFGDKIVRIAKVKVSRKK